MKNKVAALLEHHLSGYEIPNFALEANMPPSSLRAAVKVLEGVPQCRRKIKPIVITRMIASHT